MTRQAKSLLARLLVAAMLMNLCLLAVMPASHAASKREINVRVEDTLDKFRQEVPGANDVLQKAKGVLVFPRVYQGGLVFGGKYGKGGLLVNNQVVDYYNIVAASYGFQLGGQRRSLILAFMTDEALANFRTSSGWNVGADASVAVITLGAAGSIDAKTLNKPVLAFVVDQKGLMYNLSLEGAKITRLK